MQIHFRQLFVFAFAGPLSSIWKEWIKWCIEFGVEANSILAVPYDWRLSPSKLEERDLYFHKLKFVHIMQILIILIASFNRKRYMHPMLTYVLLVSV